MTRILFITSTRLGDAVLSTGLIDHLLHTVPEPRLTIVCGSLPASLFAGVPHLERLIALRKKPYKRHWWDLWRTVAGTRWDIVVDLRNSAVSRLIRSRRLYAHGPKIDSGHHKVEQNADVMKLGVVPSPRLWIAPRQNQQADCLIPAGGPVIAVGPTANWIGKTWPAERFAEIVAGLIAPDGIFPGARVAVFAAPGEEKAADAVLQSVPQDLRLDLIARCDPGTAAAAVARCAFYIGNDSGLMHCAAAAGVPTLGLFGPSYPAVYRPWGPKAAYVQTPETFEQLTDFPGYDPRTLDRSLMTSLSVAAVKKAIAAMFAKK